MTNQPNSSHNGESRDEMTVHQQVTPFTNAVSPSISATSVSTAHPSPNFQATPNSQTPPNLAHSRIVQAFAAKLGTLVFWRKVQLGDGQEVIALCFPTLLWEVDPVSKELKPR